MSHAPQPPRTRKRRWRRWALIPPLLLMLIGFGVLTYRISQPDWRGLETGVPLPVRSPGPAIEPAALSEESSEPATLPEAPSEVVVESDPPPEPEVQPDPAADVEPAAPVALPSDRILALAADLSRPKLTEPVEPPVEPEIRQAKKPLEPVDPQKVWQDIRREAASKNKERAVLESIKDQLLEEDLRGARERQAEQVRHRREGLAEQNQAFREDLAELLSSKNTGIASEIRKLANLRPPRPRPSAVNGPIGTPREQTLARSVNLRRAWVAKLRLDGQQDSVILADLVEVHRLNLLARNGPKTDNDAVLRAAIDLLSVPINAQPDKLQQALLISKPSFRSPSSSQPNNSRPGRYGASHRR